MKIGYISCADVGPGLHHYRVDGGAIHIQEVCCALQKLGHDVFLIAGKQALISEEVRTYSLFIPPLLPFARVRNNLRTIASQVWHKIRAEIPPSSKAEHSVGIGSPKYDFTTLSWSPVVFWKDIKERVDAWEDDRHFYHRACQIIDAEQPDVLYQRFDDYRFSGVDLARHYKLPLIIEWNGSSTFRTEWRQKYSSIYIKMIRQSEWKIFQRADAVIVITQPLKDYLVKLGISQRKVFVMSNGVDVTRFFPDEARRSAIRSRCGLNDKLVVGFVGSFRPYHGVHILIDCVKFVVNECPHIHFLIVGDGPSLAALKLQAREKGLMDVVTFTGNVPYQGVPAFINATDITVAPYPKLPEFFHSPIKLFEYMAVAKPVIVSRYKDTELVIVDHNNGLLVEPGDAEQLAQAILELAASRDMRERLGTNGRRMVEEKYTWVANANKIMDIYKDILQP